MSLRLVNPTPNISNHVHYEIRMFQRYLAADKRYGFAKMVKHRYWRKYMGISDEEYLQLKGEQK